MDDGGHDMRMEDAIEQGGNGEKEAHERAGSADIEESTRCANGGTDENESAKGADERGEGNEERIGGMNVMTAAGEEVAEFVGEEDCQESGGERKSGEKAGWIFIEESEGAEKFVERSGLVVGVGDGELCAGDETSGKREKEKRDGEDERFDGGARENRNVELGGLRKSAPVIGEWKSVESGIGWWRGHKEFWSRKDLQRQVQHKSKRERQSDESRRSAPVKFRDPKERAHMA